MYVSGVRPARLPGRRRRPAARRHARRGTPRWPRSTSARSTSAGPRSASASTPSTRRSRTRTTGSSTAVGSPTFPHVRRMLADAYARLLAMKMYAARSADYFRAASAGRPPVPAVQPDHEDEGHQRGRARRSTCCGRSSPPAGFEKDTYFESAAHDIRALPKLEGTVHVNLALVLKFLPEVPGGRRRRGRDLRAGRGAPRGRRRRLPVRPGAGVRAGQDRVPRPAAGVRTASRTCPTWRAFLDQVEALGALLMTAPPVEGAAEDLDFLLTLGQLFTQVVYAQLVAEAAGLALVRGPGGPRPGSVSDLSDLHRGARRPDVRGVRPGRRRVRRGAARPARRDRSPAATGALALIRAPDRCPPRPRTRSSPRCCPTTAPGR